jgi:hypothetical protein
VVHSQPLGEARRDQGCLQAVLEWKPHPEVGRKTEGPDDFRGTDAVLRSEILSAHRPTVTAPYFATTSVGIASQAG